ncbi:MAG: transcription antitermination factor NusB [Lachnospiraceae bacterium]|jgi:N utilization substance protein B
MGRINRKTELREVAFLILFSLDFQGEEDIRSQIDDFLEGEDEFTPLEQLEIGTKVLKVAAKAKELDEMINAVSVGWKTKRMTKVDLTVLRLAGYELFFDEAVPEKTAINEAVELAKSYGTENSGSFVNGILAKLIRKDAPQAQLS